MLPIGVSNDLNISLIILVNVHKTLQGEEKVKANQFRYVCATILRTNECLTAYRRWRYDIVPEDVSISQRRWNETNLYTYTHKHMQLLSLFERTYKLTWVRSRRETSTYVDILFQHSFDTSIFASFNAYIISLLHQFEL